MFFEKKIIFNSKSLDDTSRLAQAFSKVVSLGDVIILEGELGAGKTAFSQAFAKAINMPDDVIVNSPTFSILHEYTEADLPLRHADFYRLEEDDEVFEIGALNESDKWILLVEWGERFANLLNPQYQINIFFEENDRRRFEIKGSDEKISLLNKLLFLG